MQPLWLPADGTQLVTGIGSRVLVYGVAEGDLLHSLRGHKVSSQPITALMTCRHANQRGPCLPLVSHEYQSVSRFLPGQHMQWRHTVDPVASPCRMLCTVWPTLPMASALPLVGLTTQSSSGRARYASPGTGVQPIRRCQATREMRCCKAAPCAAIWPHIKNPQGHARKGSRR